MIAILKYTQRRLNLARSVFKLSMCFLIIFSLKRCAAHFKSKNSENALRIPLSCIIMEVKVVDNLKIANWQNLGNYYTFIICQTPSL